MKVTLGGLTANEWNEKYGRTDMKKYLGVKMIEAKPMNLGDYNRYKSWTIPEDEDPMKEGYMVVYPDGYVSWSPKEIFEEAYREISGLTFGLAVEAMKKGARVARKGWNGKGMWIELSEYGKGAMYKDRPLHPHILMATAQGDFVPWLASQTDMLAEDWEVVE